MEIPAWVWMVIGIIIAAFSGYVYTYVPKNGGPNMAMAVFFFIGIIFIVVGIVKVFLQKNDSDPEKKQLHAMQLQQKQQHAIHAQRVAQQNSQRQNSVEEQIRAAYAREQGQIPRTQNTQVPQHPNQYAKHHQYQGPVNRAQEQTTTHHAPAHQIPTTHHTQTPQHTAHHTPQTPTHHQTSEQHQNTSHTIIQCTQCGTRNYTHSHYCHMCGGRLK
ncbi:MAG: hypothetical protein WC916_03425 [Candidatus Woesearchaeota archaeon]